MVATDTSSGRSLGGILARGENEEECEEFLKQLSKYLPFPPHFFTIDFSPSLKSAIKKQFPSTVIGHDYFHASKLLNRGLRKEMMRLQRKMYNYPIVEFKKAMKKSLEAEKSLKIPTYIPKDNLFLLESWNLFKKIFVLYNSNSLDKFKNDWKLIIDSLKTSDFSKMNNFYKKFLILKPKCGFTLKNYEKISKTIVILWRKVIREERTKFEEGKSGFIKVKYLILKNPSNMKRFDKILLKKYLKIYPWLRPIRKVVRIFHYQFKAPRKSWRSIIFLNDILQKDSHHELISCVKTLTQNEKQIFAYRQIWERFPALNNNYGIRSNHEQVNRKINMVARNQFGLRNTESARIRLQGVLGCPFIVSKDLLAHEHNHL